MHAFFFSDHTNFSLMESLFLQLIYISLQYIEAF